MSVLKRASANIKRDVLASCIQFPRTASLANDESFWEESVTNINKDTFLTLQGLLNEQPEMIAINVVEELSLIFEALKSCHETLRFDLFDTLHIYYGGVDLVRIVNNARKEKPSGRSVTVEINSYRQRLHAALLRPEQSSYLGRMLVGFGGFLLAVLSGFVMSRFLPS